MERLSASHKRFYSMHTRNDNRTLLGKPTGETSVERPRKKDKIKRMFERQVVKTESGLNRLSTAPCKGFGTDSAVMSQLWLHRGQLQEAWRHQDMHSRKSSSDLQLRLCETPHTKRGAFPSLRHNDVWRHHGTGFPEGCQSLHLG
jgi:hypothetical protein